MGTCGQSADITNSTAIFEEKEKTEEKEKKIKKEGEKEEEKGEEKEDEKEEEKEGKKGEGKEEKEEKEKKDKNNIDNSPGTKENNKLETFLVRCANADDASLENKKIKTINKNEKLNSIDKNEEKENINDEKNLSKNFIKEKISEEENRKELKKEKNSYDTVINEEIEYSNKKISDVINNDKTKESKTFINEINEFFIVCLRCKCRNPHIEKINFDCNLKDINVSYYCACFPEHNLQSESLGKLIISTKPLNLCPIHSEYNLKFFCNICKKFFCEKCERDSEEHIKNFINLDIIMSKENAEQIKTFLYKTKNEVIYNQIINDYLNNLKKFTIPKYHLKIAKNLHENVTAIILLQSGLIATGSYDKTICTWKIKELSCDKKIKVSEKVLSLLEFKPNMLLSSHESTICLWDLNSYECIHIFNGHELWVNCLVKYDDKFFVSASNDHKIIIWDYEQKKNIKEFEVFKNCIFSLIKLNDGNLCLGGADSVIIILDWKGKIISKLKGHNGWVICLCQMNDETLLSGSDDRTIKVWKNYKCIKTIEGHLDMIKTLLKLNDNYFASGSFDKTIKIWNIKTFVSQQTLTEHSSNIICLLKLDNNDLVSSSGDKSIKIWGHY